MGIKNKKYYTTKKCKNCGKSFESLISRNQQFCCVKCSSQYTANDKYRISKIKKTKLERYGSETYVNSEKAKKTCLDKYGVDNPSKSVNVKSKILETMTEKWGGHYFTTDEFKKQTKKTLGVDNVSQLKSTKEKVKKTVNERFGVDNVFQSETIKKSIQNYYESKYGVTHPSQISDIKRKKEINRKKSFYKKLTTTHKLNLKVEPLFTLDEYINTDKRYKYKFRCLTCLNEFEDHIDGGHLPRCPVCYPLNKGSICETEIYDYLCEILEPKDIQRNVRNIIDGELDLYIPQKNIAIEYNSFYYHSFSHVGKDYHLNKTIQCELKGIRLIHIFEDEWIFKKNIIKSKLNRLLTSPQTKIYARNCEIKEIDTKTKNEFLNENHIQGEDKSKIKLGAYYNNELVSVMTFGKARISLGNKSIDDEYELIRFSTNQCVIGIGSKLLKHFIKNYNPLKITSYADRRYSTFKNTVYDKMGFVFESITNPNYWYFKNGYSVRHHRYTFRKSELLKKLNKYDENLTEYENMQLNGYDKIYDCGNFKYVWKKCS